MDSERMFEASYWAYGIFANMNRGDLPTLFYSEPLELTVEDGKFVLVKEDYQILNLLLQNYPVSALNVLYSLEGIDSNLFYVFVSQDKTKVQSMIDCSEVVLRLVNMAVEKNNV